METYSIDNVGGTTKVIIRNSGDFIKNANRIAEVQGLVDGVLDKIGESDDFLYYDVIPTETFRNLVAGFGSLTLEQIEEWSE